MDKTTKNVLIGIGLYLVAKKTGVLQSVGIGATPAQQKYIDRAARKKSRPTKTQFRKDIEAAKRAIDAGKLTHSELIKRYGLEAVNAVSAENEYL